MSWFKKKFKKFRQPSQQLVSSEIPTHIPVGPLGTSADLATGAGPEGVNNGEGSRIAPRDRSMDHRPLASGPSTSPIPGVHEREVPSDAPNEQLSHDAPDLSAERQSEVQNRMECEDRETVTEQPQEAPPERISEDDHISRDAHDAVQSGGSGVVERDYGNTTTEATAPPVDVPKEPTGGFSPLKIVLGTISAVYTHYKVRLQPSAQNSSLMNPPVENRRRRKQD
ncbi:hypothetical protein BDM02DRAFT_276880 [Thelephora ganbajun]|uniref:Uncharacterized protein n=1 Tax=Thelephora ganbajun TaxID=370292 RepID=A0ACB6Z9N5_THEGA|nr:hypothetical protein BDM02DRAFT_276880 [Thelephora ganbajun]